MKGTSVEDNYYGPDKHKIWAIKRPSRNHPPEGIEQLTNFTTTNGPAFSTWEVDEILVDLFDILVDLSYYGSNFITNMFFKQYNYLSYKSRSFIYDEVFFDWQQNQCF